MPTPPQPLAFVKEVGMPKTTAAVTLNFQGPIFFCYTTQQQPKVIAVIIGQ